MLRLQSESESPGATFWINNMCICVLLDRLVHNILQPTGGILWAHKYVKNNSKTMLSSHHIQVEYGCKAFVTRALADAPSSSNLESVAILQQGGTCPCGCRLKLIPSNMKCQKSKLNRCNVCPQGHMNECTLLNNVMCHVVLSYLSLNECDSIERCTWF